MCIRDRYAFSAVCAASRIVGHVHVHRADAPAFATVDAFGSVASYAQQRKVAHGLEKYSDGANVLAECAVILKRKRERYAQRVVKRVAYNECPEHYALNICDARDEKPAHERQRCNKRHITQPAQATARILTRCV